MGLSCGLAQVVKTKISRVESKFNLLLQLSDPTDRARLVDGVLEEHARLDAVVLNAGLGWAGLLEHMPGEAVEGIVALNLTGVIELTRLALPHLLIRCARTCDVPLG